MADIHYYCLLIEIDPVRGGPYLDWLKNGHIYEVYRNPGFLAAKLIELDEKAPDGWRRFMVLYSVKNKAVLKDYWAGEAFKAYAEKAKEFKSSFRITRVSGKPILEYD